jgi:hypothetical protein
MDFIEVPLSMNVSEIMYITGQNAQGELKYSFSEKPPQLPPPPMIPSQPPKLRGKVITRPPDIHKPPVLIPFTDRPPPLFPGGFPVFSNSVASFPPSLDLTLARTLQTGRGTGDEFISLRKNLEIEIRRQ